MADYPIDVIRCPTHGVPDCSPLLDGCSLPSRLAAAYDAGKATDALVASAASQAVVSGIVRELETMLADDTHIAWLRPNGYGLRHGFPCRADGLMGCPVDRALAALHKAPDVPEGYYRVSLDDDGNAVIGEAVEQTYDPLQTRMTALIERLT
jgi:hypothetical protein